ncbi:hypothetical protein GEMRC1_000190 [Eukaryota sp. GEM-RC1]
MPTPVVPMSISKILGLQPIVQCIGLKVSDIIIASNKTSQPRFSELTLDMYRMTVALEHSHSHETVEDVDVLTKDFSFSTAKYLLYRPSVTSLLQSLASSCTELSSIDVLLVYVSADGAVDDVTGEEGLLMSNDKDRITETGKDPDILYNDDFTPFLRRNIVLVIDSCGSRAFSELNSPFNSHVLLLLAPKSTPSLSTFIQLEGSLFTLFLHCPALGFLALNDVSHVASTVVAEVDGQISAFLGDVCRQICCNSDVFPWLLQFLEDDSVRVLVLRCMFFRMLIFTKFSHLGDDYLPLLEPGVPEEVWEFGLWVEMFNELDAISENQRRR